jgi:hypothetical protein
MALTKVIGAGAEGLTLSSTSLTIANGLTLTDGDIALASGHGISFAATGDGGVSTPTELLDDYEEGTWTPVLTDGSTTLTTASPNAHYTRTGNSVHAEFYFQRNDSANNTATMILAGLPFAHIAVPAVVGQCWIDNSSSDIRCMLYIPSSYSQMYFVKTGATSSYVSINEFDNSRYMYGAFDYLV